MRVGRSAPEELPVQAWQTLRELDRVVTPGNTRKKDAVISGAQIQNGQIRRCLSAYYGGDGNGPHTKSAKTIVYCVGEGIGVYRPGWRRVVNPAVGQPECSTLSTLRAEAVERCGFAIGI